MELTVVTMGLFLFAGMASHWVSWRWGMPAIVVMTVAGMLLGPGLGFLNPDEVFGDLMKPLVSLAVAIILFEGSMSLDREEILGFRKPVQRMITVVPLLSWVMTALAVHFIIGLSWTVAFVIGGLFVVTGPTVIMPLLRQANLQNRPSALLRWEGIVVDPIGPLYALFAFQIGLVLTGATDIFALAAFFGSAIIASVGGYLLGHTMGRMFERKMVPYFMQTSMMFAVVVLAFGASNLLMPESGLLTVTAMGMALANMGLDRHIFENIRHFKENISVLLISAVFIILTASVTRAEAMTMLDWRLLVFVAVMILLVRPLSVWLGLANTGIPAREKTIVGWIAPRGIVALTVSSYFETILVDAGFTDAEIFVPLTLALVFITVTIHGFTLGPLARKLGLSQV
ncbi:cation:proton antiporter [Salisediminibacterium halotolerans]|uniref:NhaP-type Na+/H+ or K+/H+ antiporter n=1 Tax=Salisediminibacterium halotolerans TaxID=517425 RepID=A0A1H9UAQ8_9BACI|nr:sodium:proton antiporter [Salisediminibacterium haloalkalitolerans]SES06244.1 NhaP-type Na+/H+ or K+/H+ antiporter [Salisediminibacterium haloalkalitolerans]